MHFSIVPIPAGGCGGVVHQIIWRSWSERPSKSHPISFFSITFKSSYRKQVNKESLQLLISASKTKAIRQLTKFRVISFTSSVQVKSQGARESLEITTTSFPLESNLSLSTQIHSLETNQTTPLQIARISKQSRLLRSDTL